MHWIYKNSIYTELIIKKAYLSLSQSDFQLQLEILKFFPIFNKIYPKKKKSFLKFWA